MTRHLEEISVCLEDGGMIYLNDLPKKIKRKGVMEKIEEKGQYIIKHGRNKYCIPVLTAKLIATNTRGLSLSTVMCPHCKETIIMTLHSIIHETNTWCCNCSKNLYNSNDKTIRKVW